MDPQDLYELNQDLPQLEGVTMLHYLDGFVDAGSAGGTLTEHLLNELDDQVIARFDTDALIDYRARRPPMTYLSDRWESYEAPELAVHLLRDAEGSRFLLLSGPEPDRGWDAVVAGISAMTQELGVRLVAGFHGIPVNTPHTRPLAVTAHGTRSELVDGFRRWPGRLQIPGSLAGLLELRLGEAGRDALGLAVHVPHYLAQSTYPSAALRLLAAVASTTGLSLPEESLREKAREVDTEVDTQVADSTEAQEIVADLERQYDTASQGSLAVSAEDLPTADELGSQFERFLADQHGPDDGKSR